MLNKRYLLLAGNCTNNCWVVGCYQSYQEAAKHICDVPNNTKVTQDFYHWIGVDWYNIVDLTNLVN